MSNEEIKKALQLKRALEVDFETAAALKGRAYYSAVSSLPKNPRSCGSTSTPAAHQTTI